MSATKPELHGVGYGFSFADACMHLRSGALVTRAPDVRRTHGEWSLGSYIETSVRHGAVLLNGLFPWTPTHQDIGAKDWIVCVDRGAFARFLTFETERAAAAMAVPDDVPHAAEYASTPRALIETALAQRDECARITRERAERVARMPWLEFAAFECGLDFNGSHPLWEHAVALACAPDALRILLEARPYDASGAWRIHVSGGHLAFERRVFHAQVCAAFVGAT